MILPALSLSQPWAEMVLSPDIDKTIENRVWNTKKRGPFLIHAAQGMTSRGHREAIDFASEALRRLGRSPLLLPILAELKRGGIVGAAEILDVIPLDRIQVDSGGFGNTHPQANNPWLMAGCFGFVLGRRVRLPFRAYSGRQRWFNVELTLAEEATLRAAGLVSS